VIQVQSIPHTDRLYYRVHVNLVKTTGGKLGPHCFRDPHYEGMSVDWSEYSTAEQTRNRQGVQNASKYGIACLPVAPVWQIEGLSVKHDPTEENDAHSNVLGLAPPSALQTRQRLELWDACGRDWLLAPGDHII
jgi:hypothetical protein